MERSALLVRVVTEYLGTSVNYVEFSKRIAMFVHKQMAASVREIRL